VKLALNVAAFQAGWFACVLGAAHGLPWIGVAAAAAVVAWHTSGAQQPARELTLVVAALAVGATFDSALATSRWVEFAPPAAAEGVAPYWILALWALLATTLNLSLGWLRGRPALAAALGFIAGPLAYLAGARLGALEILKPAAALVALALGWAVVLPLLLALARRLEPRAP
jgi:hypothetical protein